MEQNDFSNFGKGISVKIGENWIVVYEEMSFKEIVDDRRCTTDAG